jgi:uncharacterized membrane protein YbhN (UPF0104 family)
MTDTRAGPPASRRSTDHAAHRLRLRPANLRSADVRIFSSASDAPRARRPTDVVLLVLALVVMALLALAAPGPGAIDKALVSLFDSLPGLVGWLWEIAYDLLFGWALFVLVASIVGHGRRRLVIEELLAAVLAVVLAALAGQIAGTGWSDTLRSLSSADPPAVYPAMRLALAAAIIVVASPHLSRPLRFSGRLVVTLGAFASVSLGIALPIGVVAGLAAGFAAAAAAHLLLGSPGGRLSLDQVAGALADLGVQATNLRYAALDPSGVSLVLADTPDEEALLVKTYGRDAWDGQLLTSIWSSLWNRGETPRFGGRLQQVEHEAFVTLYAERQGISVMPVVAAGMADGRDAVLVVETKDARPLATLGPGEVDDRLLARIWELDARLYGQGIAHGSLDGYRVGVRSDGTPVIGDLAQAQVGAPDAALRSDRAQLLVSTALLVDQPKAVEVARATLGPQAIEEMLPYLQPAALGRPTRRAVREQDWSLDDLRSIAAEAAGVELPKLEQIRRVTWASVAMVAVIGLVAYAVISAVANVGLDNLIEEFQHADTAWLLLALLLAPTIGVAQAFATIGACIRPVRFGPVALLQYSIQFVALAVPSSAARIALEIRFFGKVGMSSAGAVAVGVIDSVCGFILQMLLVVVILLSGLATLDLPTGSGGSRPEFTGKWLLVAAVVVVLLVIVALAVPRFRSFIKDKTADVGDGLRVLRSPAKVLMILGGNLVAQVMFAIILGVCLRAFGHQISLAELILTYNLVSLFAGFMPVPGGMGVSEAGYTAALVAFGVPHTAALSTAMAFRLVTYYLPPIWGGLAMKWLRAHEYI